MIPGIPAIAMVAAIAGLLAVVTNTVLVRTFDPKGREALARQQAKAEAAREREAGRARVLADIGRAVDRYLPIGLKQQADLEMQLVRAGIRMSVSSWWGIVILSAVLGLAAGLTASAVSGAPMPLPIPITACGLILGILVPRLHLTGKTKRRREQIEATLPGTLELLSVVVEAGQTVERGIKEIANRTEGPLSEEFARVDLDITKFNRPTGAALKDMAERCQTRSVGMFCSSVAQAMESGTPISRILKSQAKIASENYFMTIEEKSNKISVKMIFPTILCLLPPILIISLAPTVIKLIDSLASGAFG